MFMVRSIKMLIYFLVEQVWFSPVPSEGAGYN